MHILLFILIFIIAIFVFGLSIVGFILRTIFGLGRSSSSSRPKQTESGRTSQQSYNQTNRRSNDDEEEIYSENVPEKRHKKIFILHRLICKRRKILSSYAVPLLFMNNVIHSWDTESPDIRYSYILSI